MHCSSIDYLSQEEYIPDQVSDYEKRISACEGSLTATFTFSQNDSTMAIPCE